MSIYKNIVLNFSLLKAVFCFVIYNTVDNESNMDIYKFVKIRIGTVMGNPVILKFVSDHLKTKEMCKHSFKKLPFVVRYVPDRYKTQKMCGKSVLKNGRTLESVPDCHKNQHILDKAVNNYPHALKFAPDCYMA